MSNYIERYLTFIDSLGKAIEITKNYDLSLTSITCGLSRELINKINEDFNFIQKDIEDLKRTLELLSNNSYNEISMNSYKSNHQKIVNEIKLKFNIK